MLGWDDGDPFRGLLAHPRIAPYLAALLGDGYRLDHQPMALLQDAGSEGFGLHGGPLTGSGDLNPELQYRCVNGKPWNALVAMAAHLVDAPDGAGAPSLTVNGANRPAGASCLPGTGGLPNAEDGGAFAPSRPPANAPRDAFELERRLSSSPISDAAGDGVRLPRL